MDRDQEIAQLAIAALDLRAACQRVIECTGGSQFWTGETGKHLLIVEGALLTKDNETLLAGVEKVVAWMESDPGWTGETEACLIDMKDAIALAYKEPVETMDDSPDDYDYAAMSAREADRAAEDYFAHIASRHP